MAPGWASLYLDCQRRFLRYLGTSPLAEVSPDSDVRWVVTGVWSTSHNGVTATDLARDGAPARIRAVLDRFRAAGVPGTWFVGHRDHPDGLGTLLHRAGCVSERPGVVMGAGLDGTAAPAGGPLRAGPPAGVRVVEVTDERLLGLWFDAAGSVWEEDAAVPADRHVRHRLYASLGLGPERPWRHWIAVHGPAPVGMVSGFYSGGVLALENVGVAAGFRRRGIGRALTLTPLRAAPAGTRWVVLGPSPEGTALYRTLGFTSEPGLPGREFLLPPPVPPELAGRRS